MKKSAFLICALATFGNLALGAETAGKAGDAKAHPQMTTEQRQKMADLHEKMAVCLRSDRPLSDCRKDMMKGCKDTLGAEGCPMGKG